MLLSFIIPTYNEQAYLARCIQSIRDNVEGRYEYEIIVVDNASTDDTATIARDMGVTVLSKPYKYTISAVRNAGVEASNGDLLVFVDGDVYLHDTWIDNAPPVLERLQQEKLVAGSVYAVDLAASWIARAWFQAWYDRQESVSFVNAGHLLMTRELFEEIGGFDPSLETAEDHEICQRARAHGANVENLPSLIAVHLGYPNSLGHFFRRERWHGKGNFSPWTRIFASRIPIFVLLIQTSLMISLVMPLVTGQPLWLLAYPLFAGATSAAAAYKWVGGLSKANFLPCMFLSWVYFKARSFSLFDVIKDHLTHADKEK